VSEKKRDFKSSSPWLTVCPDEMPKSWNLCVAHDPNERNCYFRSKSRNLFAPAAAQGCQMVFFQILEGLEMENVLIFYDHLG
jgi:hypothetical protein